MKKIILILALFVINLSLLPAQDRKIARGAEYGELYITDFWFGIYNSCIFPQYYDTLKLAAYRISNYGKKLSIQYVSNYSDDPEYVVPPAFILADATPGVTYIKSYNDKYSTRRTILWFSDDYGKNWIIREENIGQKTYTLSNDEGLLFRGGTDGIFKSENYGNTFFQFNVIGVGMESGLNYGEGFRLWTSGAYNGNIFHSFDFFETITEFPIDSLCMYGSIGELRPDVFRGGLPGEVYITSWFLGLSDYIYRASFSDDFGETFRVVYECDGGCNDIYGGAFQGIHTYFMSDRAPGVFYIIKRNDISTNTPCGWYTQICIEHYKDYGETLVGTYCHDLTKDYGTVCEVVNNVTAEQYIGNSVLVSWQDDSSLPVDSFLVFRTPQPRRVGDFELIGRVFGNEISFLDEGLDVGEYKYFVVAYYVTGCVSEESAVASVTVSVCAGVDELISKKCGYNCVRLEWDFTPNLLKALDRQLLGYNVFRNGALLNSDLVSDTFFVDDNLLAGEYVYFVVTYYSNGCASESSNVVTEIVLSCDRVNVFTFELNNNNVFLNWDAPNNDFTILGYQVYRNSELINSELVNETEYLDENLPNGTYLYQVSAVYDFCGESEKSEIVEVVIFVPEFCDPPVNVIATAEEFENNVFITWDEPENIDSELLGYNVYRDNILINSELVNETEYLDENLPNGIYGYQVSAVYDFCGESDLTESVTIEINVGIETLRATSEITIYPNPTTGKFTVVSFQFSENSNVIHPVVEIFDITGRKLLTFQLDKLSTEIDITFLSNGIYFLKIGNEMVKIVKK